MVVVVVGVVSFVKPRNFCGFLVLGLYRGVLLLIKKIWSWKLSLIHISEPTRPY